MRKYPSKVILYGGTGQAIILRQVLEVYGSRVVAVIDDTENLRPPFKDVPLLAGWEGFKEWLKKQDRTDLGFLVAIGNPHGRVRLRLHEALKREGLQPITIIHPTAWVDKNVEIGEGSQILAGSIVLAETVIGKQCIINTKASVDHENRINDGAEIAPGATLCGLVKVGMNAWICAGSTILPRIEIGDDAIVAAGAVVTENVPDNTKVAGIPAKILK